MAIKQVKGVSVPRHDTAINWSKAINFIPNKGELIVYDADTSSYTETITIGTTQCIVESSDKVRFKFGDGVSNVNILPFATTENPNGSGVGKTTPQGGEIFNDYENNQSISEFSSAKGSFTFTGTKFFYIIDKNEINKTYTLKDYYLDISSSGELAVNDLFSITTGGNREDCGTIKSIVQEEGTNNAIVTVSNWYWDTSSEPDPEKPSSSFIFRVIDKPLCGTDIMGVGASSEGYSTKALMIGCHSEGGYTVAGGKYSHAEGRETRAGYAAHAEGWGTKAMGQEAHAEGYYTEASGFYSHSEGNTTESSGICSHAEGNTNTASGDYSHVEGNNNIASGQGAHAEGLNTQATKEATHSEGNTTKATGINAHAEGNLTEASGDYSHSEGYNTKATGGMSHSEGYNTKASGNTSHSEGYDTKATGNTSHSEGYSTTASNSYAHAEGHSTTASGYSSHAEGRNTKASGSQAHAEGSDTLASNYNTHAEGNSTQAIKNEAHAEGSGTIASGGASHSEGYETTASGYYSHAEGSNTTASGYSSHAEGHNTTASGGYSHAGGLGTIADTQSQTTIGQYNKKNSNALLIVGNGSGPEDINRSNAFEVGKNGTATLPSLTDSNGNPDPTAIGTSEYSVATKGYIDDAIDTLDNSTKEYIDKAIGIGVESTDYIVQQGVKGKWTYRKWNSGLAECWYTSIFTGDKCTSPYGGLYITPTGVANTYPFTFMEIPIVSVSAYGGTGYCFGIVKNAGLKIACPPIFFVSNINEDTNISYNISVIGRWK